MNKTIVTAEPGKQEVLIQREFEAPRELVFRAFTDPALVEHWLGPKGYSMTIDRMDTRSGGGYRYIHIDPQGNTHAFHGVVHEVSAPDRIIQTFEYEGLPEKGHVSLDTTRFEVLPGNRTRVVIRSVFQSVADRDGMVKAGMEWGVREGYERLDALLASKSVLA